MSSSAVTEFDLAVGAALDRIAALERNWDAQGALRVDPAIVEAARSLVSRLPSDAKRGNGAIPAVVPMRKGNLQFEWHRGSRTLELEVEDSSTIHYLRYDPEVRIEDEDLCPINDSERLAGLIRWFVEE
jgi:hypothetical protein